MRDRGARIHQEKAARAVGILRAARGEALVPEERSLLIARHAGDRNAAAEEVSFAQHLA